MFRRQDHFYMRLSQLKGNHLFTLRLTRSHFRANRTIFGTFKYSRSIPPQA